MPQKSYQEIQKEIDRLKKDNAARERQQARLKAEEKRMKDLIRKEFGASKNKGS